MIHVINMLNINIKIAIFSCFGIGSGRAIPADRHAYELNLYIADIPLNVFDFVAQCSFIHKSLMK